MKVALFALLALSSVSLAATSPSPKPSEAPVKLTKKRTRRALKPKFDPTVPHPIDQLEARIGHAFRNGKARILKAAYAALLKKRYPTAATIALRLRNDPLFSDYASWIAGQAYRNQAVKSCSDNNFAGGVGLGEKAIPLLVHIEAKTPFSPLLKNYSREIAQTELVVGDCYSGAKNWAKAKIYYERAFQRLMNAGGFTLISVENLDHYSFACSKFTTAFCRAWFQKFTWWWAKNSQELVAVGKYFPDLLDRAKSHVAMRATQSYHSPDLDYTAFDGAMKLYFAGKYSASTKAFREFLDEFPRSVYRYRARYWLAQSLTHRQDHDEAQKMYEDLQKDTPLSYYGLLAALAAGKAIEYPVDANLPMATETDPALYAPDLLHLERARYFLAENASALASIELRDVRPRDTLSSEFLIYLAMLDYRAGNYNAAFVVLGNLIQRGYGGVASTFSLRMIFPLAFMDLIKKYAALNQLDPVLVLSLIKQESAFDSNAGSPVGATGLMQLMPTTASNTDPSVATSDLINAETNIRVGTRYLKMLLDRFNGNIVLALAGYNAGPNAADRWYRDSSKRGLLEFIESIPYRETREYVGSIIRNYYWYSKKLNGDIPQNINYFWNLYGPQPSGF